MQDDHSGSGPNRLPGSRQTKTSIRIHASLWHEKIVAAASQDERMQALLEQEDDFYERIVGICLHKSIRTSATDRRLMGQALAESGNIGFGKRNIASVWNISLVDAQKLLNEYYAVFYKTKSWIKKVGIVGAQNYVNCTVTHLITNSIRACHSNLPLDWKQADDILVYKIPADTNLSEAEKFFRHFYEKEIFINEQMVKLSVAFQYS